MLNFSLIRRVYRDEFIEIDSLGKKLMEIRPETWIVEVNLFSRWLIRPKT